MHLGRLHRPDCIIYYHISDKISFVIMIFHLGLDHASLSYVADELKSLVMRSALVFLICTLLIKLGIQIISRYCDAKECNNDKGAH